MLKKYSAHYFIMKIPNKRKLQHIAINHLSDIDSEDFKKIYKKCTAKPYCLLANDATLQSDLPLNFRQNILERIYNNRSR